jgi:uncharacterized membrane protein YphA (DoxX/SURF4 family)
MKKTDLRNMAMTSRALYTEGIRVSECILQFDYESRGGFMRALFVLGRAVFGGFFVMNGINHIAEREQMSRYASAKGVPTSDVAVPATGAMLLAGGLSIMAGFKPRQGLAAIIGFLIPVSLQMHRFWDIQEPQQRQIEMINFSKNMALIGAALMLLQVSEPWPISVDDALPDREDMYVHLGGRELRALPA